jgi:hypothetical protein
VKTVQRRMPRNGRRYLLLVCPGCFRPQRAFYGWERGGKFGYAGNGDHWRCRGSAELRYASEGGALIIRSRGLLGQVLKWEAGGNRRKRPGPWYPYYSSNPCDSRWLGIKLHG